MTDNLMIKSKSIAKEYVLNATTKTAYPFLVALKMSNLYTICENLSDNSIFNFYLNYTSIHVSL